MKYSSTRHISPDVSFCEAVIHPFATDGGLYLPSAVPVLPSAVLENMADMTLAEIGYVVLNAYIGDEFTSNEIKDIADRAFTFPVNITGLADDKFVAELFEGPTLAFKDFGARVLARVLEILCQRRRDAGISRGFNVIMATTGNTGSAVANALTGVKGVNVYVVFPKGTATRALENQFTTPGGNVHAIEVNGTIDQCQSMVSAAIFDRELTANADLISAGSANIARILGQSVYYFYVVSRVLRILKDDSRKVVVALPCGSLGNLTAGLLSQRMGLGISRFLCCENANDYLTRAIGNEDFTPVPAVPTLAYAADRSVPTNVERILDLFPGGDDEFASTIFPFSVSDAEIINAITDCYARYNYLPDTHTAMAYYGMVNGVNEGEVAVMLATAHPAKSLTAMSAITGRPIELPLQLTRFMGKEDKRVRIKPLYQVLKRIIKNNC